MIIADFQLSFLVIEGIQRGKRVTIPRLPFLIGRGTECHLRPVSPTVASRHCVLIERNGCLMLADLGSTNGTFVNGERVEGTVTVGDGDELAFGPLRFRLQVETVQPAAESAVEEAAAQALLDGETTPPSPLTAPLPESSTPLPQTRVGSRRRSSPAAAARSILSRMLREEKYRRS